MHCTSLESHCMWTAALHACPLQRLAPLLAIAACLAFTMSLLSLSHQPISRDTRIRTESGGYGRRQRHADLPGLQGASLNVEL